MTVLLNISPSSSLMYANPTSSGEDFSSYVRNHPVLFVLKQVSTCFIWWSPILVPEETTNSWSLTCSLQTTHEFEDCCYILPQLLVFFPWPKALLSHSLSESCPYLQSSLLLFEIFPVLICAIWEQGTRTTLTPPGMCKPCICTVVYRCPTF